MSHPLKDEAAAVAGFHLHDNITRVAGSRFEGIWS